MGGVIHFLLALAALAVLTELGLRWRREWNVPHARTTVKQPVKWRKAA